MYITANCEWSLNMESLNKVYNVLYDSVASAGTYCNLGSGRAESTHRWVFKKKESKQNLESKNRTKKIINK